MLCDWDMNLFPPKLNIKFLPIFFTTGISVHLADLLWPFCSYQGHGTVLGVWQISCCWGLGWSNISKINKGLVNQKVLDDWQVGEAEDVEVAFVLLRCWRWGERDPITAKATAAPGARSKTCRNSNFCKTIARNLGEKKQGVWGKRLECQRETTESPPPLSSLLPLFISSSPFSRQADSRSRATAIPLLTVATQRERQGKAVRLQLDLRVIWRTQPGKSRDRLHFQITPGNQSPLSLTHPHPLSLSLSLSLSLNRLTLPPLLLHNS